MLRRVIVLLGVVLVAGVKERAGGGGPVAVGAVAVFKLTVDNAGGTTMATGVTVTDTFPAGLTPVDLPSAGKPLETVDPQGFLEPKVADGKMVNTLGDTMPLMPAPPWGQSSDPITYRGLGFWMDVHVKYDGTNTWGNAVFFGIFQPEEPYASTPAGIRKTATLVGGRILNRIYDGKVVPIKSTVKHRRLTIDGHRAHEITARVPIKKAQLAETFSTLGMIVIDRGDGTAAVSATVISGSTTAKWLPIWREHVAQIKIMN